MERHFTRIGISGGTFDPIHHGHLIIAEEVRQEFSLEKVLFIPAGIPPHKRHLRVSSAEDRYGMVCEAIGSNPFFEASRIEIDRDGYTYTVDTLLKLKEIFGEGTKLYFIIGADTVKELISWKEPHTIFALCEFIAVFRPGFDSDIIIREIENLRAEYNAIIHVAHVPLIGISSTAVREKAAAGKSIRYLVPKSVEDYIYKNQLYAGTGE